MGARRATWWFLAIIGVLAVAEPARAEAALSCASLEIVEVFVGAEGCPSADYVVLDVASSTGAWVFPVEVRDKCLEPKGSFGNLAFLPPAAKRVLIATPAAQALFGVKADVEASLDLVGGDQLTSECYSWSQTVPLGAIPFGKALKHTTSGWVLSDPSPINGAGETGVLGVCPADASVPDADAADADEDAAAPCSGGATGSGGGTGTGGVTGCGGWGGTTAGGTTGDASASGGSDASAAGGSAVTDAGPSATGGSEAGGDCACRTPVERAPGSAAWLVVGSLLSLAYRRRTP